MDVLEIRYENGHMTINVPVYFPTALEAPDYEITPSKNSYQIDYGDRTVDGRTMKIDDFSSWKHYCVNVVAYRELSRWLEKLKELGVYDNTRIILVADHGYSCGQFEDFILPDGLDIEAVNPLLMVKDFDAGGSMRTSEDFMSNADVPFLAARDVIENPVNPFTGLAITDDEKKEDSLWIVDSVKRQRASIDDKLGVSDYSWWTVHDSIFDRDNWNKIE